MSPTRAVIRAAAVLVGALTAALAVQWVAPPTRQRHESAASVQSDFLRRWEAWRRATASFTERTTRVAGSRELTSTVGISQRFPDRIVRDGPDLSAHLGGRLVGCTVRTGGASVCVDNGGYRPDDELATEIVAWRESVGGDDASYRLSRAAPGCFRARHIGSDPRPRWGDRFDVCFDATSGVATSEVTVTGAITISVRRTDVVRRVGPAAFELPAALTGSTTVGRRDPS